MSESTAMSTGGLALGGDLAVVGCFTTPEREAHGTGVKVFRRGDEAWRCVGSADGAVNPSFLAVHPTEPVVYAAHADCEYVSAYRIDPSTGAIALIGTSDTGGRNGSALTVDPTGRFVFVCNFATGNVSTMRIEEGGALSSSVSVLGLPTTVDAPEVTAPVPQPHHAVIDPSGRFLVVPDRGLGRVHVLLIDPDSGSLAQAGYASLRPRSGPRHVVFHPSLSMAYVVTEIDSTVVSCSWDQTQGVLTPLHTFPTLPDNFFSHSQTAEIVVHPSGEFLYVSNRGADTITRFVINEEGDQLTLRGWTDTGRTPRQMDFMLDGSALVVANQQSDSFVEFEVEPATGDLTPACVTETKSPAFIAFL